MSGLCRYALAHADDVARFLEWSQAEPGALLLLRVRPSRREIINDRMNSAIGPDDRGGEKPAALDYAQARIAQRTAIVHDWFQGMHGAEHVVEVMRAELFRAENPPDIFTFHAARDVIPDRLAAAIVHESRLARLPGMRQRGHAPGRWRYLLPYMPTYFRRLPLDQYELVISSSHACAVHVRPRVDAVHACYCYTPMRYAWMSETERDRLQGVRAVALRALGRRLRRLDLAASTRPDGYAAISEAVRERIQNFYGRDAEVVHPPVDVGRFDPSRPKQPRQFLWVHRLVPYKRPELVVDAFRGLRDKLVMVGVGPLEARLRATLPPNVELRGWLGGRELVRLYEESSGFVHVGEEDFGITMVEALGAGTPVIALDRGGARDIVRHGRDGLLLDRAEVGLLREAIEAVGSRQWDPLELAARARAFSRERFLERFGAFLTRLGVDTRA